MLEDSQSLQPNFAPIDRDSTPKFTEDERCLMQRCLSLARQAIGRTAPNPMVGSVIVAGDEIVGEGFHPGAGQPHAEVFALRQAGDRARGATLYVNLEPCNHYGRTPPCTEAIIAAGIQKVVVGMIDPDRRVSGSGVERLRQMGIEVVVGVEEADCRHLNEAFIHRCLYQRPFGIFKYAMTLDGKIAAASGHSAWVTSEAARAEVHRLRATCDAVIVGGNTVRQDNPLLTSRQVGQTPLRVVMSRSLNLPRDARLWNTQETATLVITEPNTDPDLQEFLRDRGVDVLEVIPLTPAAVMTHLAARGLLSVLWECGGSLAAAAITEGVVQKVLAFIAPKFIGGDGLSPIGSLGLTQMSQAVQLERISWRMVESDLLLEGYLVQPNQP
jgi:diaminohydroxyphosphoribosylaminopyrimidine deaminase/5-amino-6-(5-phosphoribosylamino)uracil reductase